MKTEKEIRYMLDKIPLIDNVDIATRNVLKWVLDEYEGEKK